MDLERWVEENQPAGEMIWRQDALAQFRTLASIAREAGGAEVVATHRSKSVVLPVVVLSFDNGAIVQVRDNFYDWKVTVISPHPVVLPAGVRGDEPISPCYCEGFPRGTVRGPHASDPRRFTVEVLREEHLRSLCRVVAGGLAFTQHCRAIVARGTKPSVLDVAPLVREFLAMPGNEVGGSLHVVLDDGNVEDCHVKACRDSARVAWDEAGEALASVLLLCSRTQRLRLGRDAR